MSAIICKLHGSYAFEPGCFDCQDVSWLTAVKLLRDQSRSTTVTLAPRSGRTLAKLAWAISELNVQAAYIRELEAGCKTAGAIIKAKERRIAELVRLGDAMADELADIAGAGKVCRLCHVYFSHHKGNCALSDVDAWRNIREDK